MNGKHFLMAILIAVVLLAVAFTPISSQQERTSYDPWVDYNDDGRINYNDLYELAIRYGASGIPINKTALLLELQGRIEVLENQSQFLLAPAFDSGWVSINQGEQRVFWHNLNTTDVLVYVIGDQRSDLGIHQVHYGGIGQGIGNAVNEGVYWDRLTANSIEVVREPNDGFWSAVRVMIWKIGEQISADKTWHFVTNFTLSAQEAVSPLFFVQGDKWRIKWDLQPVGSGARFWVWDENGAVLDFVDIGYLLLLHHDTPPFKGIHYMPHGEGSYYIEIDLGSYFTFNFTIESYH